jgi:hypothetical protein
MRKIAAITLGVALALVGTAALAARNSSGVYSLPSGNPVVSGTVITKTWANATLGDLASEVSSSLDRSGRGGMLAPLRVPDGSAPAPTLSFTNETGTGLRRAGAGDLRIGVLGADTLKVTASGADVVRGDLTLPAAATQSVLKSGGVLAVGTSDDQEVQLVRNGVIGMALHAGAEPWFGGHRLTNIGTPTAPDDAATKDYVDAAYVVAGRVSAAGAVVSQRGPVTASATRSGAGVYVVTVTGFTVDGIVLLTAETGNPVLNRVCSAYNMVDGFTITCWANGGAFTDTPVHFVVMKL